MRSASEGDVTRVSEGWELPRPNRREVISTLALALMAGATQGCRTLRAPSSDSADFLFENVALIPMTHEAVLEDRAVAVRDRKIVSILPQARAHTVRAAQRIDGRGHYLMPALADMHVHVEGDPERDFALYLANGITTVRNMSARDYDHLRIRSDVETGQLVGPRYLVSGPSLTSRTLERGEDVARTLELHVARKYDIVKVHGTLPADVYDAVIEGAHSRGLKVSGHVQQGRPLAESLRMDSIEHAEEFLHVPGRKALEDRGEALAAAREIAATGTFVTPSLVVFDAISAYLDDRRLASLRTLPELRYLPEAQRDEWLGADSNPYRARIKKPEAVRSLANAVPLLQQFTGMLQDAGVPLLLGTDAAGALVPGFSVHSELSLLVASGLSPFEALRTGTVNVARFLGEQSSAGTAEVGKSAELVLVKANPLADVSNAGRVQGVLSQGRWHSAGALARMLEVAAARPAPTRSSYAL